MNGRHKLASTKKKNIERSSKLHSIYSFVSSIMGNKLTLISFSIPQEFDADLKSYISTMLSNLQNVGVEVNVNI